MKQLMHFCNHLNISFFEARLFEKNHQLAWNIAVVVWYVQPVIMSKRTCNFPRSPFWKPFFLTWKYVSRWRVVKPRLDMHLKALSMKMWNIGRYQEDIRKSVFAVNINLKKIMYGQYGSRFYRCPKTTDHVWRNFTWHWN